MALQDNEMHMSRQATIGEETAHQRVDTHSCVDCGCWLG